MPKNLFTKTALQRHSQEKSVVRNINQATLDAESPGSTEDVWSNDPIGTGLKSTQQLMVDWSDFSKHVFFNSAEAKTNLAFEEIINGYPFDGTAGEKRKFHADISGFTKWVYDQFETNLGYFVFDGDVYCETKDQTGFLAPEIARSVGETKASNNFHVSGTTHECWVYVKSTDHSTDSRVVYQKRDVNNSNKSVSIYTNGISATEYTVTFHISSDDFKSLHHTIANLEYDRWYHVAFTYERARTERIFSYVDGEYHSHTSNYQAELDDIIMGDAYIVLGTGLPHATLSLSNTGPSNFVGLLDEFRVWNTVRTEAQIKSTMHKNVDAQLGLQLCYRFNEPSQSEHSYQASSVVLDFSGNSLHTFVIQDPNSVHDPKLKINDVNGDLIVTPIGNENLSENLILFPDWDPNALLNRTLLQQANHYDRNNPNLITKLVPPHYFEEAKFFEGVERNLNTPESSGIQPSPNPIPGHNSMPTKLAMMSFLYVWANFFDDIKLYLDSFSTLNKVDYDNYDQIPPQLILFLSDYYGIELPNPYANESLSMFGKGENLTNEMSSSTPLNKTLDLMWRRILVNLPFLIRSRGTIGGIRALVNTLGIEADSVFRFKEYGGSIVKSISSGRKKKKKQSGFIQMEHVEYMESSPLWAYRHAPGFPDASGGPLAQEVVSQFGDITIVKPADPPIPTTFLSGSWTWEGRYVIPETETQASLFKIERDNDLLVNLVATRSENSTGLDYSLKLFLDGHEQTSNPQEIEITGVNLWDENPWYISIVNEFGDTENSLELRCIKVSGDYVVEHHSGSINYSKDAVAPTGTGQYNVGLPLWEVDTATNSHENLRWSVGLDSSKSYGSTWNQGTQAYDFNGVVSHMRFWTKALKKADHIEHAQNPYSVSVSNPVESFAFPNKPIIQLNGTGTAYEKIPLGKYSSQYDGTLPEGSWERIRQSFDMTQSDTTFVGSQLTLIDTSQNNDHATLYGEDPGYLLTEFIFTIVPPDFDSNATDNKIRIRSFEDKETAEDNYAHFGPLHSIPREVGIDDRRFSIEASLVHALNEDMINVLGNGQILNDYLGAPEMEYAVEYPDVRKLTDIYFQRLTGNVNYNSIIEFQRWFNNNFASLVEQFIPHTADFLGINFVVESHLLERHKMEYKQGDVHVDLRDRRAFSQEALILGTIRSEIT